MPASTDRPRGREPALVRGRFAPSPSGPLHFGSLVAALASYLDARSRGGQWLVRIEDLDPPREVPGAAGAILRTLEALGLEWDGPVHYQSREQEFYAAALASMRRSRAVYDCACTRAEIAHTAEMGTDGPIYAGTCREGIAPGRLPRAIRVRAHDEDIEFVDEVYGLQRQNVARAVGDFVLRRADGFFAYQLAVVVDDFRQRITRVVRGADLLDSTARQMMLQRMLGLPTPAYLHVPIAVDAAGEKLSKQTLAKPIDTRTPGAVLIAALEFLNQAPGREQRNGPPREILARACSNWRPERIARARTIVAPPDRR